MMLPSVAVVVPSSGRPTLGGALASVAPQLKPGDQLLVDVNADGDWGNAARRRMMRLANAQLVCFLDDDDLYLDGALDVFRLAAVQHPHRVLIARMLYRQNRFALWEEPILREGNVASQMICVPNIPGFMGEWTDRRESDFDFVSSTCARLGDPVWLEDVVSLVSHPELEGGVYVRPDGS